MRLRTVLLFIATAIVLSIVFSPIAGHSASMRASYYGSESGNRTASGEHFNPRGMTAAHRSLPFGTRLRVCYRGCVVVRISDRGPAKRTHRQLDLSRGAAAAIGMLSVGVAKVSVERYD